LEKEYPIAAKLRKLKHIPTNKGGKRKYQFRIINMGIGYNKHILE